MLKPLYLLMTVILFTSFIYAQDSSSSYKKKSNSSVGVRGYYGSFLTTQPKSVLIRDSYASFGEVYLQRQMRGNQDWQVSHLYPQWGLAIMFGNTGSRQYIGKMTAVYSYLNLPLIKTNSYTGSFRFGAGLGFISKPFNIETNPKNTILGTRMDAFLNFGLQNEVKLSDHISLDAGLGFIHLSNGGTVLPNLGLNTPNLFAGIRYAFGTPEVDKRVLTDTIKKTWSFSAYTTFAIKQAPWVDGDFYGINLLQLETLKRISRNHTFGAGLLAIHNRTLRYFEMESPNEVVRHHKFQLGIYAAYEHLLGKISIPVHLGFYAYNRDKYLPVFTQFGIRYKLTTHWKTELLLKSHGGQAEYINAGIGYTF